MHAGCFLEVDRDSHSCPQTHARSWSADQAEKGSKVTQIRTGETDHPCLQTTQESCRQILTYQQHVSLCCFFACLICRLLHWSWGHIPLISALGNWMQEERIRDQHVILIEMQVSTGIHLTKPPCVGWQDCLQKNQQKPIQATHTVPFDKFYLLCVVYLEFKHDGHLTFYQPTLCPVVGNCDTWFPWGLCCGPRKHCNLDGNRSWQSGGQGYHKVITSIAAHSPAPGKGFPSVTATLRFLDLSKTQL